MEVDNFQIFTATAMTGNLTSLPINTNEYSLPDIQAYWTGTPTGTFKLQTSNDVGVTAPDGSVSGLTHWTDYTGSSQAAGGAAGDFGWHFIAAGFKWLRLAYTFSSGTGTLNARVNQKG